MVGERKNPAKTTTFGVGTLIRDAVEQGCKNIVVGLGGSCTNDAGTGAVYVDGKTWSARSSDGSSIPMGAKVVVDRMEGVKLFVTPVRSACEQ